MTAPELQQRQEAEVRLSPDAQQQSVEPVIQKGTGRFVDPAAQTSRSGRGNIVVKLVAVPTADAVQQILGDTLGLNYVIEGEVSGSVTIQTARPVDQRSLIQMLAGALASNELVLINEGGFYRIAPASAAAPVSAANAATAEGPPTTAAMRSPTRMTAPGGCRALLRAAGSS